MRVFYFNGGRLAFTFCRTRINGINPNKHNQQLLLSVLYRAVKTGSNPNRRYAVNLYFLHVIRKSNVHIKI